MGTQTAEKLADEPAVDHELLVFFVDTSYPADRLALIKEIDPSASLGKVAPVGFLKGNAEDARTLGMNGFVTKFVLATRTRSRITEVPQPRLRISGAYPLPNSALSHRSNSVFTAMGFDGSGEHIGIVEARGDAAVSPVGCRIAGRHEAFDGVGGIGYMWPGKACVDDSDCTACEDSISVDDDGIPVVVNGRCVDDPSGTRFCTSIHATAVASRIASNHRCHSVGSLPGDYYPPPNPSYWADIDPNPGVEEIISCIEGGFNASGARLYVANNFASSAAGASGATVQEIESAYAYLSTAAPGGNAVSLVNESYGAPSFKAVSAHGVLADWFARYRNMLFVQAAGNSEPTASDLRTSCVSFNGLCVGAVEVLDDRPGNDPGYFGPDPEVPNWENLVFAPFSMWENISFESSPPFELEKPDVVADGLFSHIADYDDSAVHPERGWAIAHGTSFAAPALTGLLAQFRHACRSAPVEDPDDFDESFELRSALMFSQWESDLHRLETADANPPIADGTWPGTCPAPSILSGGVAAPTYPTADARLGCDYKAGVGVPDARRLAHLCRPETNPSPLPDSPDRTGTTSGTVPPNSGVPIPADFIDPENTLAYLANARTGKGPTAIPVPSSAVRTPAGSLMESLVGPNQIRPIAGLVRAGTRVRASLAYMSCPGGNAANVMGMSIARWSDIGGSYPLPPVAPPVADLQPAVDFNLLLVGIYPNQEEEIIYASEALYDTEEGFDAIVPHGNFEALDIRITKPAGYMGCDGQDEPVSLTWGVWWFNAP